MNMILHNNPTALIVQGNTLADPKFKDGDTLKTFDYVVANPPFTDKRWSTGLDPLNDPYERFKPFGTPPAKQGDYAYLLHIVRSLKSTGKGACILPHGVLFRGNAEADIRRNLVRKGYIKGIIGLPANLFYGTGIPACIVVVDKQDAHARKGIFMIDASAGFMKDGPKNRLRAQDIHKIVDVFNRRLEVPKYSRMVTVEEIEKNEFNLNLPRYIDSQQAEDMQDIEGHLQGRHPRSPTSMPCSATGPSARSCAKRSSSPTAPATSTSPWTRRRSSPPSTSTPSSPRSSPSMNAHFADWRQKSAKTLKALADRLPSEGGHRRRSPRTCSPTTPASRSSTPTTSISTSWTTGPRPCRTIATSSPPTAGRPRPTASSRRTRRARRRTRAGPATSCPKPSSSPATSPRSRRPSIKLEAELESVTAQMAELEEEHGGEEGAFSELDKVNKANVTARLKEIKGDKEAEGRSRRARTNG